MKTIIEPEKEIPVVDEVDVIVAGGGISGVAAASIKGGKSLRGLTLKSSNSLCLNKMSI